MRHSVLWLATMIGPALFAQPARADDVWNLIAEWLKPLKVNGKDLPQVTRVQLRVKTSGVRNADTDAWVRVSLNDRVRTYLDLPGDDFERGKTRTYDLMLTDNSFGNLIRTLDDIHYLDVTCEGGAKDLAIDWVELLVNGLVVYQERFAKPQWLGTYAVSGDALRASADWRAWKWEMPSLSFSHEELEQRAASFVGHFMHESPHLKGIKWGTNGRGVRVFRPKDAKGDTLRLHLDLQKAVNNAPNPDFDIDIDVRFVQRRDMLEIQIVAANLKGDGPVAAAGAALNPGAVRKARDAVRTALLSRTLVSIPFPKDVEFYIRVHPEGGVELKLGRDPLVRDP